MKFKKFKKANIKKIKDATNNVPAGKIEKSKVHVITYSLAPETFPYIYVEHYFEDAPLNNNNEDNKEK